MNKIYRLILFTLLLFATSTYAQYTISGMVTDAATGDNLVGANVYLKAVSMGAVSDLNGKYEITGVPKGTYELTISFIGYLSKEEVILVESDLVLNILLKQSPVLLQEAVVQSTRATLRETPVAFTQVQGEEIEFKLASRDLPQVMNITPSVYSSPGGGGAGDANLVVRGFSQRNVAIMINGVPVNDMENGWVYWSNWAGLGDVTQDIQIQRGLGASPYSVSSIGGVVNVLTFGASGRKEFSKLKQEIGSDKLYKTSFAFSSMLTKNVGLTALVSHKTWDGYAEGLYLDEYTYFLSIGGVFGNHSLELTGVGSPQEHGQRIFNQSIDRWNSIGFDYNQNYGMLFDKPLDEYNNKYHKPQWNLSWNWQVNDRSVLSTIAYLSWGNGYGTGRLGSSWIYDAAGHINYDAVWARNVANLDENDDSRSMTIMRNSVNNHLWTGLLSTYKLTLSNVLNLSVGIDGRYYLGEHYREVRNLLGGDYYLERYDKNNPDYHATTGDKVAYHNDGKVILYGGFAQVEYNNQKVSAFVNASVSQTGYQRIDYFNFLKDDPDRTTDWQNFLGYTAKGGVNLNIDANNNIFVNGGYFSKAPIFDNVFDFANNVYENADNETILGLELGYGFATPVAAFNINGFYTSWKDRAISDSYVFTVITATDTIQIEKQANIVGAEQRHIGVEFEGRWKPARNLEFGGMFSWSENKFQNDVNARVYPEEYPDSVTVVNIYSKDLYVSEFPMTTASLYMLYRYELGTGAALIFNPVYKFFSRYYASFDPDSRDDINDREQPWRIPDYYIFDVHTAYEVLLTNFFVKKFTFGFHIFNALNTRKYITDASDGSTHTSSSARVWYGRDRWYNASFTFEF